MYVPGTADGQYVRSWPSIGRTQHWWGGQGRAERENNEVSSSRGSILSWTDLTPYLDTISGYICCCLLQTASKNSWTSTRTRNNVAMVACVIVLSLKSLQYDWGHKTFVGSKDKQHQNLKSDYRPNHWRGRPFAFIPKLVAYVANADCLLLKGLLWHWIILSQGVQCKIFMAFCLNLFGRLISSHNCANSICT